MRLLLLLAPTILAGCLGVTDQPEGSAPSQAPEIISFTATPDTVSPGQTFDFFWELAGGEPAFQILFDPGNEYELPTNRHWASTASASGTYTLEVINSAGRDRATVSVTVLE